MRVLHSFDGAEWLFELKYDGFRALAYLEHGRCRLVSRNGHGFSSFESPLDHLGMHSLGHNVQRFSVSAEPFRLRGPARNDVTD